MKATGLLFITFGLCQGYVTSPRLVQSLFEEATKMCQGPNGEGLESSFADLDKVIPVDDVLRLVIIAIATDEEVKNIMTYINAPETLDLIHKIFKSDHCGVINSFACNELYFDIIYYVNEIAFMFGLPPLERNSMRTPQNVINLRQGGVRGLLADICSVVDAENLKAYMQDKINNDKYVQLMLEALHSPEGRKAIHGVIFSEEFQKLCEGISKLVADFAGLSEDIWTLLGWFD